MDQLCIYTGGAESRTGLDTFKKKQRKGLQPSSYPSLPVKMQQFCTVLVQFQGNCNSEHFAELIQQSLVEHIGGHTIYGDGLHGQWSQSNTEN